MRQKNATCQNNVYCRRKTNPQVARRALRQSTFSHTRVSCEIQTNPEATCPQIQPHSVLTVRLRKMNWTTIRPNENSHWFVRHVPDFQKIIGISNFAQLQTLISNMKPSVYFKLRQTRQNIRKNFIAFIVRLSRAKTVADFLYWKTVSFLSNHLPTHAGYEEFPNAEMRRSMPACIENLERDGTNRCTGLHAVHRPA
jgi:hypothetical protein